MTEQHPITPSPELIEEWIELSRPRKDYSPNPNVLATYAARWGADQELEACCVEIDRFWDNEDVVTLNDILRTLRASRRPKPLSLKEQALQALDQADKGLSESEWQQRSDTIRRALESLPDNIA